MAGRLSWFLTPTGRNVSLGLMTASSVATFAVQFVPHTYLIDKYKEIVSMYEAANPVPLSERMRKRWNDVLADLRLPEHEVKYMDPFVVFGFDLFHAGTIDSKWGAIIGIPQNFNYTDVESVDPTPIRVNNETVNWNREDAKQLLDALVLSEDAQLYGIGREVLMARHNEPMIFSLLGAFMVSSTYVICRSINRRLQLLERPMPFRMFFYGLVGLSSFGLWAAQKDILNVEWEKEADQHLAQLGDRYRKGAVEFYSKMQKRNIALRSLLGPDGESVFTPIGNERHLFRQPRIPIDVRKTYFENLMAEVKRGTESLNEDDASPAPA